MAFASTTAASAPSFSSHRLRLCLPPLRPSPSTSSVSITVTSLHSGFHQPQHRSPSSSAAVAILFSSHLLASMATPPVSSSSRHRPSRLRFSSTSDYYLDHRRHLPSLFLSLRLHRLHPDTTSLASLSLSTVLAIHCRSPPPPPSSSPPCCRAPLPSSPSSATVAEHHHEPPLPASPLLPLHLTAAAPFPLPPSIAESHRPDAALPLSMLSPSSFSTADAATIVPFLLCCGLSTAVADHPAERHHRRHCSSTLYPR